eukprot:m51a1_g14246 hypothetical protein (281) ;mRNA; r:255450-256508
MSGFDLVNVTELFEAARNNDVKRARELLDAGIDVNAVSVDRGCTALHLACASGAKQVVELLVQRGADLNIKDSNEKTPLYALIDKRLDVLAMWLVHQGANMYVRDRKGFSPYDYAPSFLQRDLLAAAGEGKSDGYSLYHKQGGAAPAPAQAAAAAPAQAPAKKEPVVREVRQEIMKVYVKGGKAYKTMRVSSDMSVNDLIKVAADKFNLSPECVPHLDLVEKTRNEERRMAPGEDLFEVKGRWPTILSTTGNDTHIHYHFMIALKHSVPDNVKLEFSRLS